MAESANRGKPQISRTWGGRLVSKSFHIIAYIEQAYRLRGSKDKHGLIIALDVLMNSHWNELQQFHDPGHVANMIVKQGVAVDHAEALNLLNSVHANGNG